MILYYIYTSDIPTDNTNTEIPTYADDTAILTYFMNINPNAIYFQRATEHLDKQSIK